MILFVGSCRVSAVRLRASKICPIYQKVRVVSQKVIWPAVNIVGVYSYKQQSRLLVATYNLVDTVLQQRHFRYF